MSKKKSNGNGHHFGSEDKTEPRAPDPTHLQATIGPTIDSGIRVADSLDNLALKLHSIAQEIRHRYQLDHVPGERRLEIAESLHETGDKVYPEGKRANG